VRQGSRYLAGNSQSVVLNDSPAWTSGKSPMPGNSTYCCVRERVRDQSHRSWWHDDVELAGDHERRCRDPAGVLEEIKPVKHLGVHHPNGFPVHRRRAEPIKVGSLRGSLAYDVPRHQDPELSVFLVVADLGLQRSVGLLRGCQPFGPI
jgi:hypothetical protein